MNKILVTGSSGLIGKKLFTLLDPFKYDVSPFDIKNNPNEDILSDRALLKAIRGINTVVHLAAIPHPSREFTYEDYFTRNVVGTMKVASACVANGVKRLIYGSSTAFYGLARQIEDVLAPLGDENIPNLVKSVALNSKVWPQRLYYGCSKVASESLLSAYGKTMQLEIVMLRFSPIPMNNDRIGKLLDVYGTVTLVEDAAEIIKLAIDYKAPLWYEAFNASTVGTDTTKAKKILSYSPNKEGIKC